ncbi:hypothetical protein [Rhodococcoides fascians]|uniref:hypothetical protein n=1 Tax=Rhodococcoides fascians TaxID=1828 RepID=UPI00069055F5|nr:hypothetical protein [Rhodococcus fascians]
MSAADQLAAVWFTHTVSVERWLRDGPRGPVYAPAEDAKARVSAQNRLVLNNLGVQVVSANRCSMSVDTPQIPVGSKVTLPASFGAKVSKVITESRHDGGPHTPNFYSVDLG